MLTMESTIFGIDHFLLQIVRFSSFLPLHNSYHNIPKNSLISLPPATNFAFPFSILTAYPTTTLKLLTNLFLYSTPISEMTIFYFPPYACTILMSMLYRVVPSLVLKTNWWSLKRDRRREVEFLREIERVYMWHHRLYTWRVARI